MNNFNFVHHPFQEEIINLDNVVFFGDGKTSIHFILRNNDTQNKIIWHFGTELEKITTLNALLKLTSQNLCTGESPTADPQQTCPTTQEQNTEKHPPRPATNPF